MGFKGALLTGFVSRSARTINEHRLLRDGHSTREQFMDRIGRDAGRILKAQSKGYAYVSAGQLDWLDLLRPLASAGGGFESRESGGEDAVGPVTRWYRTNTFYRKPHVNGALSSDGREIAAAVPELGEDAHGCENAHGRGVVFLMGPYTFTRLVENSHYENPSDLAADYVLALAANAPELKKRGYSAALLSEPSVGYDFSLDEFDENRWRPGMLAPLKEAGLTVGLNFPLADASRVIPVVEETGSDFFGVDTVYTDAGAIDTSKDLLLGVVDGCRIGIETAEQIGETARTFAGAARFSGSYYIGPSDRLSDVPFKQGLKKIRALAKAAAELE
jgi:methionine synthase II (cobalamin-independent)